MNCSHKACIVSLPCQTTVTPLKFGFNSDVGGGPEGGLTDVAIEVLHLLLTYLLYTPQKEVGIGEDQKQAFLNTLRKGKR